MLVKLIFNKKKKLGKIEYIYHLMIFYLYLSYIKISTYIVDKNNIYNKLLYLLQLGGPVFIKIGQNIANKNNIDPKLKQKLMILQENNYYNFTNNLFLIKDIDNLTIEDRNPIASGSIASIFKCKYNNKKSIIKIVHNNIEKKTILSINIFNSLRNNFKYSNWFGQFNQLVDFEQIYKEILTQTNLENEVENLNKIKNNFKDFSDIIIFPEIYYKNNDIIIESYEDGINFYDFIEKYPDKKIEVSHLLHCCFYKMFFDNMIHADLHSSNIRFRLKDEKVQLVLLDFGLVSSIDSQNIYADFINIYKKNIFVPESKKFYSFMLKVNINEHALIEEFNKDVIELENKMNVDETIEMIKKADHEGIEKRNYCKFDNFVKTILDLALKNKLRFKDYIFNICNGFILLEDYRYAISEDKSVYQERFDYADDNGFVENIRNSASNILKK